MKLFFDLMLKVMTGPISEKLVQTTYLKDISYFVNGLINNNSDRSKCPRQPPQQHHSSNG